MRHPYAPHCCDQAASHEVHDWLETHSLTLSKAYSWAITCLEISPDLQPEFLALCVTEMAKR